jgi:hypothetical protein
MTEGVKNAQSPNIENGNQTRIRVANSMIGLPAWQSLGESNPSFQVENLTS